MATTIDAKGKACPIPFMLAKKQIDEGNTNFIVEVDNSPAVENLKRLAKSQGYLAQADSTSGGFSVRFTGGNDAGRHGDEVPVSTACSPAAGDWVVFLGKDHVGEGDAALGRNLARMFLYTLDQGADIPSAVILMNNGVLLAVEDEQTIATLTSLRGKGSEILVCGTCLNHYGLTERVKVGTVSNMYDITQRILAARKMVSL